MLTIYACTISLVFCFKDSENCDDDMDDNFNKPTFEVVSDDCKWLFLFQIIKGSLELYLIQCILAIFLNSY